MKVKDIMTEKVISVKENDTVNDIAELMDLHGIGFAPVNDGNGKLIGIVTDRDIVVRGLAGGKKTVKDVMSKNLITVSPDNSVIEAARLMGKARVRRLPVTDGGKTVGVLSLSDISQMENMFAETAEAFCDICGNDDIFED